MDAQNKASIGLQGKVVNETQKTLVIRDASTLFKTVFKRGSAFEFKLTDEKVVVKGDEIAFRPWERVNT